MVPYSATCTGRMRGGGGQGVSAGWASTSATATAVLLHLIAHAGSGRP